MPTHSEYRSLLRDVLVSPGDDTARLILADWLEDHGQEMRADDIRTDIATGRVAGFVGKHDSLGWFPETHIDAEFDVSRGFISSVKLTLKEFTEETARKLFSLHPIMSVTLRDRDPRSGAEASWFNCDHYQDDSDEIPWRIYRFLTGEGGDWWKDYASAGLANASLNRACVDHGRYLVGLPPLPNTSTT